ncbi:MAG: hypothetical protein J6113_00355 [Lachnospiraceae bacterium]|nr:hypothetical protein [Lachnospiraceae bacterium]
MKTKKLFIVTVLILSIIGIRVRPVLASDIYNRAAYEIDENSRVGRATLYAKTQLTTNIGWDFWNHSVKSVGFSEAKFYYLPEGISVQLQNKGHQICFSATGANLKITFSEKASLDFDTKQNTFTYASNDWYMSYNITTYCPSLYNYREHHTIIGQMINESGVSQTSFLVEADINLY